MKKRSDLAQGDRDDHGDHRQDAGVPGTTRERFLGHEASIHQVSAPKPEPKESNDEYYRPQPWYKPHPRGEDDEHRRVRRRERAAVHDRTEREDDCEGRNQDDEPSHWPLSPHAEPRWDGRDNDGGGDREPGRIHLRICTEDAGRESGEGQSREKEAEQLMSCDQLDLMPLPRPFI